MKVLLSLGQGLEIADEARDTGRQAVGLLC